MRRGQLKEAVGSFTTGKPVREGIQDFGRKFSEIVAADKLSFEDMSIKELYEAVVVTENAENPEFSSGWEMASSTAISEAALGSSVFKKISNDLISNTLIPAYEDGLENANMLVTEETTKQTDYVDIAGLRAKTPLQRVREGQNYPSGEFGEKYVRAPFGKFGEIFGLTKESITSDQTGKVVSYARDGGMEMGQHRHEYIIETAIGQVRTALDETTFHGYDYGGSAQTLYSTDHSSIDNQTNVNLLASNNIKDEAAWEEVWEYFGLMVDEQGKYISIRPKIVLVHPQKEVKAWQFLNTQLQPDTGNNANNFFINKGLSVFTSPYVANGTGNASDWFIGDFAKQLRWVWQEGFEPKVESQGMGSDAAFTKDVVLQFKYSYKGAIANLDHRYIIKNTQ